MEYIYGIESESIVGTGADSWAEFAEQLNAWLEKGSALGEDEFAEQGRAFAARAVMIAGGERRPAR